MLHSLLAFGEFPAALLPGWLTPDAGGRLVFRGVGSPEAIDYGNAVVGVPAGVSQFRAPLPVPVCPNTTYCFGLRSVGYDGQIETNTHVLSRLRSDAQGRVGPLLPRPIEAELILLDSGQLLISCRVVVDLGQARPDRIEALAPDGAGWAETPLAEARAIPAAVSDYLLTLAPDSPETLGLRCRLGDWSGPVRTVQLDVSAEGLPTPRTL